MGFISLELTFVFFLFSLWLMTSLVSSFVCLCPSMCLLFVLSCFRVVDCPVWFGCAVCSCPLFCFLLASHFSGVVVCPSHRQEIPQALSCPSRYELTVMVYRCSFEFLVCPFQFSGCFNFTCALMFYDFI